jgi:hypothetical protein
MNSLTIIVVDRRRLLWQKFLDVLITSVKDTSILEASNSCVFIETHSLVRCVLVGLDYPRCVALHGSTCFETL